MIVDVVGWRDVQLHRYLMVLEEHSLDEIHLGPGRAPVWRADADVIPSPATAGEDLEGNVVCCRDDECPIGGQVQFTGAAETFVRQL